MTGRGASSREVGELSARVFVELGFAYLARVDLVAAECVVVGTHFGGIGCVPLGVEELFDSWMIDCRRD